MTAPTGITNTFFELVLNTGGGDTIDYWLNGATPTPIPGPPVGQAALVMLWTDQAFGGVEPPVITATTGLLFRNSNGTFTSAGPFNRNLEGNFSPAEYQVFYAMAQADGNDVSFTFDGGLAPGAYLGIWTVEYVDVIGGVEVSASNTVDAATIACPALTVLGSDSIAARTVAIAMSPFATGGPIVLAGATYGDTPLAIAVDPAETSPIPWTVPARTDVYTFSGITGNALIMSFTFAFTGIPYIAPEPVEPASPAGPFEYTHRWAQIIDADPVEAVRLLEDRDRELESHLTDSDCDCGGIDGG